MSHPQPLNPDDVIAYLNDAVTQIVIARERAPARAGDPGASDPPRSNEYAMVELRFQSPDQFFVIRAGEIRSCCTDVRTACANFNAELSKT